MKVGFIGLGNMGSGMARNLLKAGHEVTAYNRTPEKVKALVEQGAREGANVADACKSDVVITMLADDSAVENVVFGETGILASLRKGGVVAINAIHLDRIPQFDYDSLLWGERQLRSVANMTREDARDFVALATKIRMRPRTTVFPLEEVNEALLAVFDDKIDGAAVVVP